MRGKVCVLTGATSGIGRATALVLADAGIQLELVARDEQRGQQLVRAIERRHGATAARFHRTDLGRFDDVRQTAHRIAELRPAIDLLCNNAGARYDHFAAADCGRERTFAANHLGHFLLTGLLLDRLLQAGAAKVWTVSSGSHFSANSAAEWELSADAYDRRQAYARSKLANVMFAYRLADRLRDTPVASNAFAPGGVATNFARNNGIFSWLKHLVSHAARRELVTARTVALALLRLVDNHTGTKSTGKYFVRDRECQSSRMSYDTVAAERLWTLSVRLTGLNEKNCPSWERVRPRMATNEV